MTYPAGWRAGFVVEVTGGLLSAGVLDAISIQTLNNGTVVDTKTSGTGLGVTLLGAGASGKLYLNFASSGAFNEVRFLLTSAVALNLAANSLRVYHAMAFDPNCGYEDSNNICEDQIAGPGTVVNYNAGLLNVLGSLTNRDNIINGNKNSSAQLTLPAGTSLLSTPIYVGVTDLYHVYPSGNKAGFVIRANSALLSATVLNNVKIQTYLFGDLVGEATFDNGNGLLSLNALSFGANDRKKLEFTSPGKFNEVRIVFGSGIDVNTAAVDIYYAYESGPDCGDCRSYFTDASPTPAGAIAGSIISTNNYPGCTPVVLVNACNWTGAFGLLSGLTNGVTNGSNVLTPSQSDFARVTVNVGALGAGARLTVASSSLQPANSFAGFEIARDNNGLLGLLDVSALGGITVRAFNGTTEVGAISGAALLNVGLLTGTGGRTVIGFRPSAQYNRLVFEVNSGLVSADIEYRVYNAFVILDDDGDGVPNCIDQCPTGDDSIDSDGDGIPDCNDACNGSNNKSALIDTDGDGLFNNCDTDSDNDGIPDSVEDTNGNGDPNDDDADGDGIPNYLDLDSDNDGILDLYESGLTPEQIQANDPDGNGVLNGQNPVAVTTPRDTDGDGVPDYLDLDSDNDGILDLYESGITGYVDANNDGVVDGPDADNDGIQDSVDNDDATFGSPGAPKPRDTDGDNVPDYRDLDSDNDGINDIIESGIPGLIDANNDGIVDGPDADGDGIQDSADNDDGVFGSPGSTLPVDTDNDNVPDYRDLDSDNDSISDLVESGQTGYLDADDDGVVDGPDTDGDGIQDSVDGSPTFGDAGTTDPRDTDNDGTPDYRDLDSDGDNTFDIDENGYGDLDGNNDGTIDNPEDPDGDGIANNDGLDFKPDDFGGLGEGPRALPDLIASLLANGSTLDQNQERDVVITIINQGAGATTAPVTFEIPKINPTFSISIDPNAITADVLGGTAVANSEWTFVEQGSRYLVTLNEPNSIQPGANKRLVIRITATGTKTSTATLTVQVFEGTGGGETPVTNNIGTYKIGINQ
ncbi:hypothetical protein [Rhabdobacter roseus]|nr:hypothetical protein [Rhabdobacter roseus]